LENEAETPATVSPTVQDIDIVESLVLTKLIAVKETFFSFIRLNAMFPQVLDVAILLVFIIPLKVVPQFGH
jgi:hypothetical protein